MSAQQELLDYIDLSRKKGFPDEAIRVALHNAGWSKKEILHGLYPDKPGQNPSKQSIPPFAIFISILLFILLGGSAAYGLFWLQTNPPANRPTPSPTQDITPTQTGVPIPSETLPASPASQISSEVVSAHNGFGFDILKNLLKTEKDKNVVLSPTSIALALSMTYNGASESTKLAMAKTLKINAIDIEKLNEDSSTLLSLLSNPDPQVTLTMANSIWARKGIEFLPEFLNTNKKYFHAEIQSLDFSLPGSADTINDWVSKNTKGKIPTIVDKPIDPEIVMYLINALYFYGTWTNEFDPTLTEMKPFTPSTGAKIQHLLMKQMRKDYLYQETSAFQALQLPYGKNKRLSMIIMLPKTTIASFLSQLTLSTWNSWMKSYNEMEGTVILPKFKTEYKTSLKNSLSILGMTTAFSESADFSGMRKQKDLFISDVIHKTFIDVNEQGTEAAAVTKVAMSLGMAGPVKKTFLMEVNKPFFFAITDIQSGEILFMGIITNPTK
jgi:serpin B